MDPLPSLPPPRDARAIDAEHLRLLAIFHYVMAGLAVLGLVFVAGHYALMHVVLGNPELWKDAKGGPPPAVMLTLFRAMYAAFAVAFVAGALGNVLSARFIARRRFRTFSLVVAGINCLHMPLGTLLGAFTFVVLLRESVRVSYTEHSALPDR